MNAIQTGIWNKYQAELKDIDRQIKEARRAAQCALSLTEKLNCIRISNNLEKKRTETRIKQFQETNDTADNTLFVSPVP